MASGTGAQHESLRALERELKAYDAAKKKIEQHEVERNALTQMLARIVAENNHLKSRLQIFDPQWRDHIADEANGKSIGETVRFEDLFVPKEDFDALQTKYNELRVTYEHMAAKYIKSRETFATMKEKVREWQVYLERKEKRKILRETRSHTPIGTENIAKAPEATAALSARTSSPMSSQTVEAAPVFDMVRFSDNPGSSQITQDDEVVQPGAVYADPRGMSRNLSVPDSEGEDDDAPVIVAEKSLRKRKRSSGIAVYEDVIAAKKVKHEPMSSPAMGPPARVLARTDTLDLDEVNLQIDTPRKRHRLEMIKRSQLGSLGVSPLKMLKHQRSSSLPVEVDGASIDRGPGDTSTLADDAAQTKAEDRHWSEPVESSEEHPLPMEEISQKRHSKRSALSNISPNTPRIKKPSLLPSASHFDKSHRCGASQIGLVTEDGEEPLKRRNGQALTGTGRGSSPPTKAEAAQRLQSLMSSDTPQKRALSHVRTPATARAARKSPNANEQQQQQQPKSAPAKQRDTSKRKGIKALQGHKSTARVSLPSTNPRITRHTPIRKRPLENIELSDFKINPAVNYGQNHAFSETVRDRAARRCLPGCTRPECCGTAFRAMVEAGARPVAPRDLFDSSQPDQTDDTEEERILRYYLGDAYLHDMTSEYRQEMLLRAQTELLAKEVGRHKRTYERQRSPPGFWDTDMPSTQAVENNKGEAKKLEREEVAERYREAMRPGGKWLFRDE